MDEKRTILSVAELNRKARLTLENAIGEVWVEGEISRLTRHASGHWYFTLKDEAAAVSCAMFKQNNMMVLFEPKDGVKVRVLGQTSLYEARGSYQLIVRSMEDAGKGNLQEQFEKLKAKLAAEGLFDADRKKPLPVLPRKIGVVTSPTGAAVRDIINVLTRRFPNIEILLAPVTVQGEGSAPRIAKAIEYLNTRNDIDVIIAGRGGGSIEDLWAFNEEGVARAIASSDIPVISAVGHEIDFTIADFVADVRAPTPSAAAELAVPVQSELQEQVTRLTARLKGSLKNRALVLREKIPGLRQAMNQCLRSGLQQRQQRIDEAALRMTHELKNSVTIQKQHLPNLQQSMMHSLQNAVVRKKEKLPGLQQTMTHRLQSAVAEKKQNLKRLEAQLRALSPLGVLERGYSLTETADGKVIRNAANVSRGDVLKTRFAKGTVISEVKGKETNNDRES
ncbi:exodeoxyribonuclease VII large subunit [Tichowtungia aerotolerans]|uniref:Exodeoxyribonuclease 7 large subunit n=1 Tax=Tichowtungia aerotolerans TaxID=2697043 RepID=A0A6P1M233_9BACT|nr:exodeoxyribonuclease VII large subunit [Tichowtungia aerotolerans]QHI68172.1 exodeoxyribonuclease VII large subunit [Tichowtungia aerotolerans]